jgi:hypothetical protein
MFVDAAANMVASLKSQFNFEGFWRRYASCWENVFKARGINLDIIDANVQVIVMAMVGNLSNTDVSHYVFGSANEFVPAHVRKISKFHKKIIIKAALLYF